MNLVKCLFDPRPNTKRDLRMNCIFHQNRILSLGSARQVLSRDCVGHVGNDMYCRRGEGGLYVVRPGAVGASVTTAVRNWPNIIYSEKTQQQLRKAIFKIYLKIDFIFRISIMVIYFGE